MLEKAKAERELRKLRSKKPAETGNAEAAAESTEMEVDLAALACSCACCRTDERSEYQRSTCSPRWAHRAGVAHHF